MILDTRILGFDSDRFISLQQSNGRCATNKYFQIIGRIHDIESYFGIDNTFSLNVQIFFSHWGHLAIIFVWVSTDLFHIAWNAKYPLFLKNPNARYTIAHSISDANFGFPISYAYSSPITRIALPLSPMPVDNTPSYSGIYNWLYYTGFFSLLNLYNFLIMSELLGVISIPLGKGALIYAGSTTQWHSLIHAASINHAYFNSHQGLASSVSAKRRANLGSFGLAAIFIWPGKFFVAYEDSYCLRLNFHLGIIIGFLSACWGGHLVLLACRPWEPASFGLGVTMPLPGQPARTFRVAFYTGDWVLYSIINQLTCLGGLKSNTYSLASRDIGHHHLSTGTVFLWASHVYLSTYNSLAHRLADVHAQGKWPAHLKLSLALGGSSVIESEVGADTNSLTPYLYLSYDYIIVVALYVHHSGIASFLMMGYFAHGGIILIRDGGMERFSNRMLDTKSPLISHLSWISLWLGFHTIGLYIHNDTMSAFSEEEKEVVIEPVFPQIIGSSGLGACCRKALSYGAAIGLPPSGLDDPIAIPKACANLRLAYEMGKGPGDFTGGHAIALGLHLVILILLKGCLDACGSKLMADKIHVAWAFACDGPHRGGTCDISAWDSNYLATFWSLNTGEWIRFYFHWKHLRLRENPLFQFDESSFHLNAWFSNYLWFNSSPLIHAYNTFHANDLSIWAWAFLAAHLCWATGFMFLISWRGYWQELMDIYLYMHLRIPLLYSVLISDIYTPGATSIVQARTLGLLHFTSGTILTYAAFIIGATG